MIHSHVLRPELRPAAIWSFGGLVCCDSNIPFAREPTWADGSLNTEMIRNVGFAEQTSKET